MLHPSVLQHLQPHHNKFGCLPFTGAGMPTLSQFSLGSWWGCANTTTSPPSSKSLHWLPVPLRIEYKVSLLTHQCIHGHAPQYLKDLLTPQPSSRTLRSANTNTLQAPRTKLRTMGDRAFSAAAPRLWNALPDHLRAPQTIDVFKQDLKTYLFRKAFGKIPSKTKNVLYSF